MEVEGGWGEWEGWGGGGVEVEGGRGGIGMRVLTISGL